MFCVEMQSIACVFFLIIRSKLLRAELWHQLATIAVPLPKSVLEKVSYWLHSFLSHPMNLPYSYVGLWLTVFAGLRSQKSKHERSG